MGWKRLDVTEDEKRAAGVLFGKKARFLVDEQLADLAPALRNIGWNAVSVVEIGLRGQEDEAVLAKAWGDDRILLTQDRGFLDDRRHPPHCNPGVVVLPGSSEGVVAALRVTLPVVGQFRKLFQGAKVEVTADGVISVIDREHDTGARHKSRYRYLRNGDWEEWEENPGDA